MEKGDETRRSGCEKQNIKENEACGKENEHKGELR